MQFRQMSNKFNGVKMIGSIIVLGIGLFIKTKRFEVLEPQMEEFVDNIAMLLMIVSLIVLVFAIKDYWNVRNVNKALRKLPYGFDYEKELSIYKIIGQNKKRIKNSAQEFEKYSEWKEYLEIEYSEHKKCDDFYRFLRRRLRNKKNTKDLLMMVLVPTEIAMFSVYYGTNNTMDEVTMIISLIILVCFLVSILSVNYFNAMEEVAFLEDYIEVLFGKEKE